MKLRITTNFSLAMLDAPAGAVLRVQPLTRQQVKQLAAALEFERPIPYRSDAVSKDLGIDYLENSKLRNGDTLLVAEVISWNFVRYFMVEFMHDLDGVIESDDPLEV